MGRSKARAIISELGGSPQFIRKGVYGVNWKKI